MIKILLILFMLLNLFELIYYLKQVQLEGYKIKKICTSLKEKFVSIFPLVFVHFICFSLIVLLDFYLLYVLTIAIYLIGNFLVFVKKLKNIKFPKFTKRMFRLILMNCIFIFFLVIFVCGFHEKYVPIVCLFLPGVFFLNYLLVILSLVVLYPVELLIGKFYINKAKTVLIRKENILTIGITGSYGKTSTKNITNAILGAKFKSYATPKSYNTPLGISTCINSGGINNSDIFICEMGAYKNGEVKYLCELVNPDIGVVTSVGRQHMNTFKTIENVYKTKKELVDFVWGRSCVFNLNNSYVSKMYSLYIGRKLGVYLCCHYDKSGSLLLKSKSFIKKVKLKFKYKFFECPRKNILTARNIVLNEDNIQFRVYYNSNFLLVVSLNMIGIHNVTNCLLGIAVAILLNMDIDSIESGLKNIKPIGARLEKLKNKNGAIIINNGYNSNIDIIENSFKTMNLFNRKNKIVITPGLVDCKDKYEYNYKFGTILANYCTEVIIVKGINRQAILDGLLAKQFPSEKISFVNKFDDVKKYINNLGFDNVVLIENDLPDNYK